MESHGRSLGECGKPYPNWEIWFNPCDPAEERQVTVGKCGHFGKYGSTFCKAIESHGNLWKESGRKVMEGHRRPWNVKEYLGKPWNTVGTNDREVECHGRPWNVMEGLE